MAKLPTKAWRYVKCYSELTFGQPPQTPEEIADYCVDRPIMMAQVRSEIVRLGRILQSFEPKRALEVGTNYGGTLLLLCALSSPDARIISVNLPQGRFGGGYPRRKIPLFRKFARNGQQLHLIRADSHALETRQRVSDLLEGEQLDYLFLDGDHTEAGVRRDFEMYAPLVRKGGIVALHDIVKHTQEEGCQVDKFWNKIKQDYRHQEIIDNADQGWAGIGILWR